MANFKARARALDMLGRQQIANIATAVSELYKNAYDAYAGTVVADYFREDRLFVIRDNGAGMTETDFTERWLVLATGSKTGNANPAAGYPSKLIVARGGVRPLMGEKGIGRLAISAIGPQVLVVSRAVRGKDGEVGKATERGVAAFINWTMFEQPGLDLHEVVVPVCTFESGASLGENDVRQMVGEVRENLERLREKIAPDQQKRIENELNAFDTNAHARKLGVPGLGRDGHGTQFFVAPVDASVTAELEIPERAKNISVPRLTKLLLGFGNTMTEASAVMQVSFNDHRPNAVKTDLIAESEFWSASDFERSDHHISGRFDETGVFRGRVKVFDRVHDDYEVTVEGYGKDATACGSFEINLGYIQGSQEDSSLDPATFEEFAARLQRIAGLYVYKNGIRVLPYGDSEFDYLELERRRSLKAGRYFFSYRRMFGYVALDSLNNGRLQEKAGREGFRESLAYREFRELLQELLAFLALEFFGTTSQEGKSYNAAKERFNKIFKARAIQQEKARKQREAFERKLKTLLAQMTRQRMFERIEQALGQFKDALAREGSLLTAAKIAAKRNQAKREVEGFVKSLRVVRPGTVGFTPALTGLWEEYLNAFDLLENELAKEALEQIDLERDRALDRFSETERAETRSESLSQTALYVRASVKEAQERFRQTLREFTSNALEIVKTDADVFENLVSDTEQNHATTSAEEAERLIEAEGRRLVNALQVLEQEVAGLELSVDQEGNVTSSNDGVRALEDEILAVQERAEDEAEWIQLGLSISIVGHEFDTNIKVIRRSLSELGRWRTINPSLSSVYNDLRTAFQHIEQFLTMLTPLQRRSRRERITIRGVQIAEYLHTVFAERLRIAKVELNVTRAFREFSVEAFTSTLFPAFVNLVDNGLHWVQQVNGERTIELDARYGSLFISDTGPGIRESDYERVFEYGYSRKPGGRGLGLSISKRILERDGFELRLVQPNGNFKTVFEILIPQTDVSTGASA